VALVATLFRIVMVVGSMGEGIKGIFDSAQIAMVLQAGEARASGLRVTGLLLIATFDGRAGRRAMPALLGAGLAATSFAWIGHAWGARNGGLSLVLLGLHLLCVAFWVGALIPLWIIGNGETRDEFVRAIGRFASLALVTVSVLVLAGTLLLMTLLRSVADLWETDYGRFVLLKLVVVLLLLGIATFNRYVLTPRLEAGDGTAFLRLRHAIASEVVLAAITLLVTATFTTLVGPG